MCAEYLVKKFGKEGALIIANIIFKEHYRYTNPYAEYISEFNERYTNVEMCEYWRSEITKIEQQTD